MSTRVETAEPESSTSGQERPSGACCLCPPLRGGGWVWADDRHATCSSCYDKLRELLAEIRERYLLLDPRPHAFTTHGGRTAPGYGSRAPANEHVVVLTDPRSSQVAKVWLGADGRVHAEQEHPPPSVPGELCTLAWSIAEHRGVSGPGDRDDVYDLVRFIDRHVAHITKYADLSLEASSVLRALVGALRPATGQARRRIGGCPAVVGQDEVPDVPGEPAEPTPVRCNTPLYAPLHGDSSDAIRCPTCGAEWSGERWRELGRQLQESYHPRRTATAVVTYVHVEYGVELKPETIRQWAARKYISTEGVGRERYDLAEVVEYALAKGYVPD